MKCADFFWYIGQDYRPRLDESRTNNRTTGTFFSEESNIAITLHIIFHKFILLLLFLKQKEKYWNFVNKNVILNKQTRNFGIQWKHHIGHLSYQALFGLVALGIKSISQWKIHCGIYKHAVNLIV